jgi:S1-C subfamily serine protease
MSKRLIFILLGLSLVVLIGIWVMVFRSPDGLSGLEDLLDLSAAEMSVGIQAPPSVIVGDEITMVIRIQNLGDAVLEIDELLFPDELMQAVVVTSIFPGSTNQRSRGGMTAFEIGYGIAPNESMDYRVTMNAIRAIDFQGELQVKSGLKRESVGTRVVILTEGGELAQGLSGSEIEFDANVPYRSAVKVTARYRDNGQMVEGWSGSGSIVSSEGLILTSAKLVLPRRFFPVDDLVVSLTMEPDQPPVPMYRAEVLQADRTLDLAVIRITTDLEYAPVDGSQLDLPAVDLGDADDLQLGAPLAILGYPRSNSESIMLTRGEIGGFAGQEGYGERALVMTWEKLSGENSGGLVSDGSGNLVAIPTQLGTGPDDFPEDCQALYDTNRDGEINSWDECVPGSGLIDILRPIDLAQPLIEAAMNGETSVIELPFPDIPVPQGTTTLFSDDFSSTDSGWEHGRRVNGFVGYHNGEYRFEVDSPYAVVYGVLDQGFVDAVITVRSRIVTPAQGADFGVICRYQDGVNYYAMSISQDQYAAIWKLENNMQTMLMDWVFSSDIPRYDPATITASCKGDELILAVDGVVLGRVTDSTFTNGKVGLLGGVWEHAEYTVVFDNIEVKLP